MADFRHYAQKAAGSRNEAPLDDGAAGRADGSNIMVPAGTRIVITTLSLVSEHAVGSARFRIVRTGPPAKIISTFAVAADTAGVFLEAERSDPGNGIAVLEGGQSYQLTVEQPGGAAFASIAVGGRTR